MFLCKYTELPSSLWQTGQTSFLNYVDLDQAKPEPAGVCPEGQLHSNLCHFPAAALWSENMSLLHTLQ